MMDFKLTIDGELETSNNDIDIVFLNDDIRFQQAFCRVQSVIGDWYDENTVGADLEEIIGFVANNDNALIGKNKIISALIIDATYKINEIYILTTLNKNNIAYKIYLRNSDKLTSKILYVSIDIVKGVNVRIGVD